MLTYSVHHMVLTLAALRTDHLRRGCAAFSGAEYALYVALLRSRSDLGTELLEACECFRS
jgi:hypothetical protein